MTDDKDKHAPDGDANTKGAVTGKADPPGKTEPRDAHSPDAQEEASGWSKGAAEALREENAELKDKLLRVVAEMENLRRRTEREKTDTAKYAISNFARDVLTIADNIARAIEHVPGEAAEKDPALKSFLDGVQVTERELMNMLERHGIAKVDPEGEKFDPNKHQAMFEVQSPDVPEGTVVQVVQPGYVIADRVLRPAMVGVSKGGPKPAKPAEAAAPAEPPQAANDDGAKAETGAKASGDAPEPDEDDKAAAAKARSKMGGKVDKSA